MARFSKDAWYMAGWARELGDDEVLARRLLDVPVLIFRRPDGLAVALHDLGPHRPVKHEEGDARATGSFGLEFALAAGVLAGRPLAGHPWLYDVTRVIPVVERHAALWIWLGHARRVDAATIPDLTLLDGCARERGHLRVSESCERVVEGMMALTHPHSSSVQTWLTPETATTTHYFWSGPPGARRLAPRLARIAEAARIPMQTAEA